MSGNARPKAHNTFLFTIRHSDLARGAVKSPDSVGLDKIKKGSS
jgi:hypothetical protein